MLTTATPADVDTRAPADIAEAVGLGDPDQDTPTQRRTRALVDLAMTALGADAVPIPYALA